MGKNGAQHDKRVQCTCRFCGSFFYARSSKSNVCIDNECQRLRIVEMHAWKTEYDRRRRNEQAGV